MITRRNLCSIALAGLFPLAVSAADKKPALPSSTSPGPGTPGALLKPSAA